MTPIDKAIKALEPFAFIANQLITDREILGLMPFAEDECGLDETFSLTVADFRALCQALSDLSSLKLESGDVAWLRDWLDLGVSEAQTDTEDEKLSARADRILAFLGQGGEG